MEKVHIRVDPEVCVGSATCMGLAPNHFKMVDEAAVPIVTPALLGEELQDAVGSCPVQAISIRAVG